jgi:hypothetical protein
MPNEKTDSVEFKQSFCAAGKIYCKHHKYDDEELPVCTACELAPGEYLPVHGEVCDSCVMPSKKENLAREPKINDAVVFNHTVNNEYVPSYVTDGDKGVITRIIRTHAERLYRVYEVKTSNTRVVYVNETTFWSLGPSGENGIVDKPYGKLKDSRSIQEYMWDLDWTEPNGPTLHEVLRNFRDYTLDDAMWRQEMQNIREVERKERHKRIDSIFNV